MIELCSPGGGRVGKIPLKGSGGRSWVPRTRRYITALPLPLPPTCGPARRLARFLISMKRDGFF